MERVTLDGKIVIGLTEFVTLFGDTKKKIKARIDTGATRSSMDSDLAKELHLGPIIERKKVKSAHGSRLRPIIEANIELAGKKFCVEFTLASRDHMKYKVLIGQNALKNGYLIDPTIE